MVSTDKLLYDLESQAEAFKIYWGGIKLKVCVMNSLYLLHIDK